MVDVQKVRFNEPLLRPAAKRGTRDSQSINANELPPVKRLDGEVVRTMEIPFSEGTHYDLWAGQWEKGAGEVGGVGIEKVSPSLTTPIPLIRPCVGGHESAQTPSCISEYVRGSAFADCLYTACSSPPRSLETRT